MSKTIEVDYLGKEGVLNDAIIKKHIVPSIGVGAAETIRFRQAGWVGESAALAVGLTRRAHQICKSLWGGM